MRSRRTLAAASAAVLLMVSLSACGGGGGTTSVSDKPGGDATSEAPETSKASVTASIPADATGVKVNRSLRLDVADGTLENVTVNGGKAGPLRGALSTDKLSWQSTSRLQPGSTYQVQGTAVDAKGRETTYASTFTTEVLPLDRQTFPSFVPLPGSTVGVGMPVIIRFDVPVTNHAAIQRHLKVTSVPAQAGAFHWISDTEVHWRPQKYWQAGTKVTVAANIDSVPAGNGVYGQKSRTSSFTVGRSMVSKVDMNTHQMRVFKDGKLIRTIPITTGQQPKFTTRSGTKVIIEKFRRKRMSSETVGIPVNSADGYDIDNVEYAMRITYSGEFVHAAPWSVGSQGRANVSHGCTGMSTSNAKWLYDNTIVGDVVEYTGTSREMTLTNGYGDWNLPFNAYSAGA
ncbi:MAG: L,D-transpeptidase family protein [Nocardioidaceae bacterium]|nr:L,D-transpeptidase family protein [Nocardioidaceae bacterium]